MGWNEELLKIYTRNAHLRIKVLKNHQKYIFFDIMLWKLFER